VDHQLEDLNADPPVVGHSYAGSTDPPVVGQVFHRSVQIRNICVIPRKRRGRQCSTFCYHHMKLL